MSKIGRQPIDLLEGVQASLEGRIVEIIGPKGSLSYSLPKSLSVEVKEGKIFISSDKKSKAEEAKYGTARAILANMVKGVTSGWSKQLELVGSGFRAELAGPDLLLTVGYSHPVKIEAPEGISFKVEKSIITIDGVDRELVGQVAANIRNVRPPEPYKGKGIKYVDEIIRRKAGKAAKAAVIGATAQ